MAIHGTETSFYVQTSLVAKVDNFVQSHQDIFKSRSHFINAAVVRQLRLFSVDVDGKELI